MKKLTVCLVGFLTLGGMFATAGEPGEGVKVGDFVVGPYADADLTYDSNVKVSPDDEQDDVSATLKAGVTFKNTAELIKLRADVWGLAERFADLTEEDHEDFGESMSLTLMDREQLEVILKEGYDNITSLDYGTGSIEARELIKASAGLGRTVSDKVELDLAYAYDSTDYDENVRQFDWDQQGVTLSGTHKMTDKTDAKMVSSWVQQTSDGNLVDADFYTVLFGVKTRKTEKVTADAGFGWSYHDSEESISMPAYGVNLNWKMSEKLALNINGRNTIEPAAQNANNYNINTRASVELKWSFVEELSLAGSVSYNKNDFDRKVDVNGTTDAGDDIKKSDETLSGALTLSYDPPAKYLSTFLKLKYDDKTATLAENEYQQTTLAMGVDLMY